MKKGSIEGIRTLTILGVDVDLVLTLIPEVTNLVLAETINRRITMPYKNDHVKVLKVLAAQLPKRPSMKTSDIVEKGFKKDEDGDRRVRNCYRMLRKYKHIEIADRGDYRITQAGQTFYEKLAKNGFKVPAPEKAEKKAPAKKPSAGKKAAVKAKKAKVAAKAKATKKPTPKKAPAKKAPAKKESKPASKPTNGKTEKPAPKSEAKPTEAKSEKASAAQLQF
jgi:hypothetical protein